MDEFNVTRWYILKGFAYPIIFGAIVLFSLSRKSGGFLKNFAAFVLVLSAVILGFTEIARITYNLTKEMRDDEERANHYKVYFNPEYPELLKNGVKWFTLAAVALLTK